MYPRLTQEDTSLAGLKQLDGRLVRLVGTVVDMMNVEVFTALIAGLPADKQPANFFSDYCELAPSEDSFQDGHVFHERTVAVVRVAGSPFVPIKAAVTVADLYNLPADVLLDKVERQGMVLPVFVKTYACQENTLLVGKSIEVAGFFHMAQRQAQPAAPSNDMQMDADKCINPDFAPVLHAVRVAAVGLLDRLDRCLGELNPTKPELGRLKTAAMAACRGDELAAQLLLCSLVSNVSARPNGYALDALPLNIYNIARQEDLDRILHFVAETCPQATFLQVTLHKLGSKKLYGKKDYDLNCIEQGLFLPEGSLLVLEESRLEAGTLGEVGVKNAAFVNNIVQNQKLYFDFDYCNFEAFCSCGVLGLSKGKSIFEFDHRVVAAHQVPFEPAATAPQMNGHGSETPGSARTLQSCVVFVKSVAKSLQISEDLSKSIEQDFVQERKVNASFSQDSLRLALSLSRYMSLLEGLDTITPESYQKSKQLVLQLNERNRRLASGSKQSN